MVTTIKPPTQAQVLVPLAKLVDVHAHVRSAQIAKVVSARLLDAFTRNGKNIDIENLLPVLAVLERAADRHARAADALKGERPPSPAP